MLVSAENLLSGKMASAVKNSVKRKIAKNLTEYRDRLLD
jgi:hypothetical protein